MPKKLTSAMKQARASVRRQQRNHAITHRIHTGLRRFQELVKENPVEARTHGQQVISWLDRAVKTQVMHRNAGRRYKTRVNGIIQKLAR